ncbi:MAG: Stp1/IreP family PP2C-type Ser/Thr phosphatase [Peptococcaceae bacterium]|jgi:protein phosphatase|nr:Stp1/IreP family PP2C-type Ser/Thr phosphatase [Peptococcaceae bacterium]
MALRAAGRTDVGLVRKENQDSFLVLEQQAAYAVADGMGGHAGGKQASVITIDTLRWELENMQALDRTRVEKALATANARITKKATEKNWDGMGTTLVLAYHAAGEWNIAHIGDSRAYMVNDKGIYALTKDHSLVGELLANGSITMEEAKVHPHRNILTRALGAGGDPIPEWNAIPANEAAYLLLCSDGLYNMVDDEAIRQLIIDPGWTLDEKANRLVDEAKHQGGVDNITVILIAEEGGL